MICWYKRNNSPSSARRKRYHVLPNIRVETTEQELSWACPWRSAVPQMSVSASAEVVCMSITNVINYHNFRCWTSQHISPSEFVKVTLSLQKIVGKLFSFISPFSFLFGDRPARGGAPSENVQKSRQAKMESGTSQKVCKASIWQRLVERSGTDFVLWEENVKHKPKDSFKQL